MSVVVAIVQARMGSARLPGKSLQPIAGRPMLAHVLARALSVKGVDRVVLATSSHPRDAALVALAESLGVPAYAGDEHDVLSRYATVASALGATVVMRLTGDCPLLAPEACEAVLGLYRSEPVAFERFASNDTTCSGYPDGTDCEVFSRALLQIADATLPKRAAWSHGHREHVTSWMRQVVACRTLPYAGRPVALKLSVDTPADLEAVRRIHGHLSAGQYGLAATLSAAAAAGLTGGL